MALQRSGGMFNVDGGLWFDTDNSNNGRSISASQPIGAKRYGNINDFQNLLTGGASWIANQWGNQNQKLADTRYGYKIIDTIWTAAKQNLSTYTASSWSAAIAIGPNQVGIGTVLKNLSNNKYLYVDPSTINNQAASVKFSFVNSHQQATRITDFIPVLNWLNNSVLGDGPLGYEIERYFFTKKIEPTSYSFFSGGPTGGRDIERAFIPFSKERGRYLHINDKSLPPNQMTFTFTTNFYAAVRFQNIDEFETILNAGVLGEKFGWQLPQILFNNKAVAPAPNPFQEFWCDENNGPFGCIGTKMTTCDWLCKEASIYNRDFREFQFHVNQYLLNPDCYPNIKEFISWWGQQDRSAFDQWLLELWVSCGGQLIPDGGLIPGPGGEGFLP